MLTYIETPKFLIVNLFAPEFSQSHQSSDGRPMPSYGVLIEISPEVEADLPAYCRERVESYSWHGVPDGTRGFRVRSGPVKPRVFGIAPGLAAEAAAMNVPLDQIVRGSPGRIAVTMGRRLPRTRRGDSGSETWPILRGVHVVEPHLPTNDYQGFQEYLKSMESHWGYPE